LPGGGRGPMRTSKGISSSTYVALVRTALTEHGMAYGPRGLRPRSLDSSRGSHAPPGRTGKPSTGPSQAGVFDTHETLRYARCEALNRCSRIIQDRGKRGLPLANLDRQLYNPNLYLKAYGKIYRNAGALTPGATPETADGMAMSKIQAIIAAL